MLIRGLKQLFLVVLPAALLLFIGASLYQREIVSLPIPNEVWPANTRWSEHNEQEIPPTPQQQQQPELPQSNEFPDYHHNTETSPEQDTGFKPQVEQTPTAANEENPTKDVTTDGESDDGLTLQEKFMKEIAKTKEDERQRQQEKEQAKEQDSQDSESETPVDPESASDSSSAAVKPFDISATHREISSVSTEDGKYFLVDFGDHNAYNTNLIPHPQLNDTWLVIAQQQAGNPWATVWFAELVCDGYFSEGKMVCRKSPLLLPIASTFSDKCQGNLAYFGFNNGPHDARVFYGPDEPYAMFGSNSAYACFGLFMQDLRTLVDWGFEAYDKDKFRRATELQKPVGHNWGEVEKNWFIFWDTDGEMYTHHDSWPKRVFSKTGKDGSQGEDLAPLAAASDDKCLAKYMPPVGITLESIHQATNSLSITTCKRSDPFCVPSDDNTFIMSIFHWKSFYDFHGVYEPYVMLFKRSSPFEVHAISTKPLWIRGRGKPGEKTGTPKDETRPKDQTEMLYVTSMSWKQRGLKYHGYADDILFLGFGVEDSKPGVIDVAAGDLIQDLGLCSDA